MDSLSCPEDVDDLRAQESESVSGCAPDESDPRQGRRARRARTWSMSTNQLRPLMRLLDDDEGREGRHLIEPGKGTGSESRCR